jgi:hypothetical protein
MYNIHPDAIDYATNKELADVLEHIKNEYLIGIEQRIADEIISRLRDSDKVAKILDEKKK